MSALTVIGGMLAGGPATVVVKSTAILALASVITFALRRGSAAVRHLIWLAALGGCAALTLLIPVAPEIAVPVAGRAQPRIGVRLPFAGAVTTSGLNITTPSGRHVIVPRSVRPVVFEDRPAAPLTWIRSRAGEFVAAIWFVGCLVVLGRCALGHLGVARIVRRSRPVSSASWDAILVDASLEVGLRRTVELLQSDDVAAPVTSGFINPVILLPRDADLWSDERRRIVLVHELAHIARHDYVAQLVATAASALFWFHPLIWFAVARLRAEAENAADDRVLGAGTAGVTYASHLLELARVESALHMTAAVAVGMVRASRLEGRFRAMLDTTRSRAAVSPRLQAVATSLTLAAMIPIAGVHTVVRPAPIGAWFTSRSAVLATTMSQRATNVGIGPATVSITGGNVASAPDMVIGDSTIDKTIDAAAGERLTLDLETGGSVVLHGWDEPRIRMRASLGGRDWPDTRVSLERVGGGVRLLSDFSYSAGNRNTSHSFELWVPRHMNVDLSSSGGSLRITDLTGEFRGHTGGGAITIEGATGHASLTTGGGKVYVTDSDLGGTVSTGGGEVIISNVTGGISGSSGSGPVISYGTGSRSVSAGTAGGIGGGIGRGIGGGIAGTIRNGDGIVTISNGFAFTTTNDQDSRGMATTRRQFRAPDGAGAFTLNQPGGSIDLEATPNGARLSTGGGRVFVGSSGGFLGVSTGGGDIELPRVGGDVSAWTGAGSVTITVVNADGTEHSVDVFTGRGRVVLELPANLDATFELETAYTEGAARRTTIESDFTLDNSETQTWDDREGSPRKYVRARGVVGNGRGLIRVRAVNGDIVVRRR